MEQVCRRWRGRTLALAPRVEIELPMIERRLAAYERAHGVGALGLTAQAEEEAGEAATQRQRGLAFVHVGQSLHDLAMRQRLQQRQRAQERAQPWEAAVAAWLVAQLHGRTPAAVYFKAGNSLIVHVWRLLADALLPTATR